ncbi:hypothetical protein IFM89_017982 [Coptis chinensis]|uniref:ASCH domain-containing protein n=1 Tax=Coptis chinensis TaxID=261450 RepID=A0A835HUM7_9MAGN|nr:hypothetical protein IFM89_017982 [Coptis chinensis]
MKGGNQNQCLTMHQPWASLLVHGIKRIEGRSWPAILRGRLWIHAAAKVPDSATIKTMEDFYREIYAVNGITDLKFPENYPVSRLLGCVEVVGCVRCEELVSWEEVPEGVRLEGQTKFCWLCEKPQKLIVPLEMRGYQDVYNLERKIYEVAVKGLCSVEGPLPVNFPLPDPQNPFSLKPGSLNTSFSGSKASQIEKPPNLSAAIAGARAAATQFSRKEQRHQNNTVNYSLRQQLENKFSEIESSQKGDSGQRYKEGVNRTNYAATQFSRQDQRHQNNTVNYSLIQQPENIFTGIESSQERVSGQRYKERNIRTNDAATQFSRKEQRHQNNTVDYSLRQPENKYTEEDRKSTESSQERDSGQRYKERKDPLHSERNSSSCSESPSQDLNNQLRPSSKFSRKEQRHQDNTVNYSLRQQPENKYTEEDRESAESSQDRDSGQRYKERKNPLHCEGNSSSCSESPSQDLNNQLKPSSKIFAAALRGLRTNRDAVGKTSD